MRWQRYGCVVLFVLSGSQAGAETSYGGGGTVGIAGSIIETPCAIDTGSRDQSIDMGSLPTGVIAGGRAGPLRPFSIELVNCTVTREAGKLPDWRSFRVTFEGRNDNGLFGVTGEARGVGLLLTDAAGTVIHPGEPAPAESLSNGNRRLDYRLRLTGNGQPLRPGSYRTSVRFRMDYY